MTFKLHFPAVIFATSIIAGIFLFIFMCVVIGPIMLLIPLVVFAWYSVYIVRNVEYDDPPKWVKDWWG